MFVGVQATTQGRPYDIPKILSAKLFKHPQPKPVPFDKFRASSECDRMGQILACHVEHVRLSFSRDDKARAVFAIKHISFPCPSHAMGRAMRCLLLLSASASSSIMIISMTDQETMIIYADTSVFGGHREIAIYSPLEVIEYED